MRIHVEGAVPEAALISELRVPFRLRTRVLEAIVPAAPSLLAERRSGDVLARLVEDVDTLDRLPVRVLIPSLANARLAARE
ncbi:MAG TPA: hypothetical protein VIK32_02595 [Candidatus Limnocylindrales bacterium]